MGKNRLRSSVLDWLWMRSKEMPPDYPHSNDNNEDTDGWDCDPIHRHDLFPVRVFTGERDYEVAWQNPVNPCKT
jgi:hypothetical protein